MRSLKALLQQARKDRNMLKIAIIGLGARGAEVYGKYLLEHPESAQIVAIADPNDSKRAKYQRVYQLEESVIYSTGQALLNGPKVADAVIIATPDQNHYTDVMLALKQGYDILLEKPISPNLQECIDIRDLANQLQRKVVVCHVLRYAPLYQRIKRLIDEDTIGEVVLIDQIEHIGYWHFAHSFVRGNWRNKALSAPVVLAKTCHDLDNILWFMGERPERISSMGNLFHFKAENAPEGATKRCLDGCKVKDQCPYDAEKIYIQNQKRYPEDAKASWPFVVLDSNPTEKTLYEALKTGPYGRCVYHCDNDVMDHQIVNIGFDQGKHAHLTLVAHTGSTYRQIKVMGTKGEITANDRDQIIQIQRFDGTFDVKPVIIDIKAESEPLLGHGGGDARMMREFIEYVEKGSILKTMLTSIDRSVDSHIMAFAAETSRMQAGALIKLNEKEA